jgi:hypothetical protein
MRSTTMAGCDAGTGSTWRWPREVTAELRGLIETCTAYEPSARPELAKVMAVLENFARVQYDKRQHARPLRRR